MSIETAVYDRLTDSNVNDLVSGRITPVTADQDSQLPLLIYTIDGTQRSDTLDGGSLPTVHALTIDIYAIDLSTASAIAEAAYAVLHLWRGGDVMLCIETGSQAVPEEAGYHWQAKYS